MIRLYHENRRRMISMDLHKTEFLELYARFENAQTGSFEDIQLDWPVSYKNRSISLDAARKKLFVNFCRLWDFFRTRIKVPSDADRFVFIVKKISEKMYGTSRSIDEEVIVVSPRFWVNGKFTGNGSIISRFGIEYMLSCSPTHNLIQIRSDCQP